VEHAVRRFGDRPAIWGFLLGDEPGRMELYRAEYGSE
jgi:hypothetical protein